jgi:poly(beta-D-mannuronate) lyase
MDRSDIPRGPTRAADIDQERHCSGPEDLVIDLSTLIALLTALASATTPTEAGPVGPGTASPPAQHCRATTAAPTDPARSDGTGRQPGSTGTRTLPSPLDVPDERTGTSPDGQESRTETPRQLRSDSDDSDDDKEIDTGDNDTEQSDDRESGRIDDASDRAASRDPSTAPKSHRTAPERPRSQPAEPRTADDKAVPDSGSDPAESSGGTGRPSTRIPPSGGANVDDTGTGPRGRGSGTSRSADPPTPTRSRKPIDDRCADPPPNPSDPDPSDPNATDPAPEPDPSSDAPAPDVEAPSDLVDLGNWYLTLPTGLAGDPDTVQPAQLAGYSNDYFRLNKSRNGVVFTAPVTGATTKNSHYPRSELREMNGTEEAAWSNESGRHTLRATEAVTELPESKPELVTAQIHGGDDDVMQIRLEGNHLMVQYADGAKQVMLDPDYRLGTPYDIEIVAAAHSVQVSYNGNPKAQLPLSGSTWYFKAGAYVQSNPSKGDASGAAGQVIIYALEVDHR